MGCPHTLSVGTNSTQVQSGQHLLGHFHIENSYQKKTYTIHTKSMIIIREIYQSIKDIKFFYKCCKHIICCVN